MIRSVAERFWSKVVKTDRCWNWTGACARGYGHLRVGDSAKLAHRLSWEFHRGPIPARDRKLTWDLVSQIRAGDYRAMPNRQVARLLGVDPATILRVRNGECWAEESGGINERRPDDARL